MALALRFEELLTSGEIADQAALARLAQVKVARQKDLVRRIRKLVKLRGEWPESHPDDQ